MTPLIGFRTSRQADPGGTLAQVIPSTAAAVGPALETPSRAADYAYRIAALAAGLVLLATSM
ncbi:MAG TPA: hypothetical protein VGG95_01075 [Edaphobacter sp.]|jgi:hypothetical protein